ncbi:MAG: hypothetical protein AAB676_08405 [Verrucomicrobiota bacterium]
MNQTKPRKLPLEFEPETAFAVAPVPGVAARGPLDAKLEQLKERLLDAALEDTRNVVLYAPLKQAALEAAALAWATPFPLLVLPGLFEEKAQVLRLRAKRQVEVRRRSQLILEQTV